MEMAAAGPCSKKRKSAGIVPLEAANPASAAAEGHGLEPTAEDQQQPHFGAGGGGEDRISQLPDAVLGEIVSLLHTKEGARTQIFASRWRHIWRSAPLNLDHHCLWKDEHGLNAVVSSILSAHRGPGRRFCAPVYHLRGDRADAWLRSPALDNLQELEMCSFAHRLPYHLPSMPLQVGAIPNTHRLPTPGVKPQRLRAAALRFCGTLCVAIIGNCKIPDSTAQALHFPKLKKLSLEGVQISESLLHTMIAGCPTLECLLIQSCSGFRCVRINSSSIRSIGCDTIAHHRGHRFRELVIENAPCLERLLQLDASHPVTIFQKDKTKGHPNTLVISAPKLETLGCLSSNSSSRLTFDSTVIQGLRVDRLTSGVCTVKILAIDMHALSLDAVIDLMRCFPCLEKLYIESYGAGKTNFWRRKHRDVIRSFDIPVKTIAWRFYRGIKSHVDFATFFVLNARVLELMTFQVHSNDYNEEYFAQQHKMLQLDSKASRGARFHFTRGWSHRDVMRFRVYDLDLADPFETRYPSEFRALL